MKLYHTFTIGKYYLEGGGACPEQYDVFIKDEGKLVGYLRLRHGQFTVESPSCGGNLLYATNTPKGDGCFEDEERDEFLNIAIKAIDKHLELNYEQRD